MSAYIDTDVDSIVEFGNRVMELVMEAGYILTPKNVKIIFRIIIRNANDAGHVGEAFTHYANMAADEAIKELSHGA